MSGVRAVLLTGNGLRHRYAASRLADGLELTGIVVEAKPPAIASSAVLPAEDVEVMRNHLAERDAVEGKFFGGTAFPDAVEVLQVPHGGSNSAEVLDWVRGRRPDVVLLYGTSIIRPPLLDAYPGRVVNMHLGLSPYYRGAGTNFWPLVDDVPECVGITIHLAILKVDAGAILTQVRPRVEPGDRAHEIGTKAIVAGLDAMRRVVPEYLDGRVEPATQDLSVGRVYRRRDFHADAVRRLWANLEGGMVPRYLENEAARRSAYPILERV